MEVTYKKINPSSLLYTSVSFATREQDMKTLLALSWLPLLLASVAEGRTAEEWTSRVAVYQLLTDRFSTGPLESRDPIIGNHQLTMLIEKKVGAKITKEFSSSAM